MINTNYWFLYVNMVEVKKENRMISVFNSVRDVMLYRHGGWIRQLIDNFYYVDPLRSLKSWSKWFYTGAEVIVELMDKEFLNS